MCRPSPRKRRAASAPFGTFLIAGTLSLSAGVPAFPLTLESLGHSAFRIITDAGVRVVLDPYADNEWPGLPMPPVHADLVLVTHPHWDHDAWRAVRGGPKVMEEPGTLTVRDVSVRGHAGRHAVTGGEAIGFRNTVFVIEAGGLTLCHLGDNGPPSESPALAEAIGRVDVLMIPVDADHRVLTYDGAAAWIEALAPRVIIPMHYRIPRLALDHVTGIGTIDDWLGALPPGRAWRTRGPGPVALSADDLPAAPEVWVVLRDGQPPPGADAPATPDARAAEEARERAQEALARGDLPVARDHLQRAADADPGDVETRQKLGFLYLDARRPDRALEFFRAGTKAAGGDPGGAVARPASLCWLGLGMALDLLGRREEAREAYRRVIAMGINDDLQVDHARRWLEGPYTDD